MECEHTVREKVKTAELGDVVADCARWDGVSKICIEKKPADTWKVTCTR